MKRITRSELHHQTTDALHGRYRDLLNELARHDPGTFEHDTLLVSLDSLRRELAARALLPRP